MGIVTETGRNMNCERPIPISYHNEGCHEHKSSPKILDNMLHRWHKPTYRTRHSPLNKVIYALADSCKNYRKSAITY